MGRCYQLSKNLTKSQKEEITHQISGLPTVKNAVFLEDCGELVVDAGDHEFPEVMARAVNLVGRIADGCELTFSHFQY